MEDYKTEMKDLLLQYYSPVPDGNNVQMFTSDLLRWFRGIIPAEPVNEHDVYEVLKESGFKISQKIETEKMPNPKFGTNTSEPKKIEVETDRVLVWDLYEIT